MATPATMVWEIRPSTGDDNNGGGFDAAKSASGTDYSLSGSPHVTFNGSTITATGTSGSAVMTISGYTVATTDVGNVINITGGTNFTTGRYSISSVSTGSSTWTLDRSCATGVASALVAKMGGAAATIGSVAIATNRTAGNKYFVKAEATITTTASIAFSPPAQGTPTNAALPNRLIGYTTTRGDNGRVSVTLSTNTGLTAISAANSTCWIENFNVDCASLGTSTGISVGSNNAIIRNCKVANFTTKGISVSAGANSTVMDCEVTGGTAAGTIAIDASNNTGNVVIRCYVHDNACSGIGVNQLTCVAMFNLVTNNTGASSDGILSTVGCMVMNNTCYANGRHGIFKNSSGFRADHCRNNLLVGNGTSGTGYGIVDNSGAGQPACEVYDGNAFYNNATGTRSNMDDTTATSVNAYGPYTNVLDVILTGDPFVNSAGGDFRLNGTNGAGLAARGTGTPGALPGYSQVGHPDFGVLHSPYPPVGNTRVVQNVGTY